MFNKKNHDNYILSQRIKGCSVFSELSDSDIKALLKIAHIREYSAGEKVFTEGTIGLCFYIIVKGSVNIASQDTGEQNVIREFKEGDYFSEVHLFSESNHSVTCISKEVTKLMVFSKPDFEDLTKINPKLGNRILLKFLDFFGQKLDEMYKENKELKQNSKN